ncbi:MAG: hypothetical protein OXP69_04290 [Spirochaetaceae bacterium]|nr:hypothetical protein [Spirochaetaceae bacterium]MDE0446529.1 hypothetical protein [Spirochaetaceae bacterium]
MSVRSIRITEDLEAAIRYVAEREDAEQAQSLRKLARMGFEAYVAGQYRVGEISLRQAAGLLGVTLWEALDRLAALGATGNATAESVLAGLDTLEATNDPGT